MKTTVTKLLATVAATSTIFGMSTLPAFAAEGKSASNGNSVNISDVNATAETRALFDKLKNSGKGDLRFGQQHTTDENISSSASQGDVYEMTGKYPAVFGWDAGLALRGAEKPGSGADKNANAKALAQNITDADSKGAIVTLSAHWYNPGTGKDFNDTTAVASELLPGGKYSGTFNKELDAIAATAQQAKRSDGTLIPIIFRPLHENNGSWFWWGEKLCTPEEYKALWHMTVDTLQAKGVDNALYAYSPGTEPKDTTEYLKKYPGDELIDVIGFDTYQFDRDAYLAGMDRALSIINSVGKAHNKVIAVTETGYEGIPDAKWWTGTLLPALEKYPLAYVLVWRNAREKVTHYYAPYPGQTSAEDFVEFYNNPKTLFAADVNLYQ